MAKYCQEIIFVKGLIGIKKFQARFKIFYEYTDLVEPLSLDEAYLDTQTKIKCQFEEIRRHF
jgi:DNA polymerase-4